MSLSSRISPPCLRLPEQTRLQEEKRLWLGVQEEGLLFEGWPLGQGLLQEDTSVSGCSTQGIP